MIWCSDWCCWGCGGGWQGALSGAADGFLSGTIVGGLTGMMSTGANIARGITQVAGRAHGAPLHKLSTHAQAGRMAASGRYSQIGMNKSLRTMGLNGGRRPDVIGIGRSGPNRLVEVISPKQSPAYIRNKMQSMLYGNPGSRGKIVYWVRYSGRFSR